MEIYSNVYQYLRQEKLEGLWGMKKSGVLSLTDKMDLNVAFAKAVYPGMISNEEAAAQDKLCKIRAKLRSGARLTGAEKEFLKSHDPQLYQKVTALEKEAAAYEERLAKCRTRDDAERIKTEKLAEIAANMKEEDADYMLIRLTQMRESEKKVASLVSRKPWQRELDRKQREAHKKAMKKEAEKIKKKKAEKKRREEAARKKRMEEKIQEEAAQKEKITDQIMEGKKLEEIIKEQEQTEKQIDEAIAPERMTGEELAEEQIAKFMIAAGMMDNRATRVQLPDPVVTMPAPSAPPSLGKSTGYVAYRAAVYMPELTDPEEEKKPYVRRA